MEELKKIIKDLKLICNEEGVSPSQDTFLKCAVKIYNSKSIELGKNKRVKEFKEELATPKQIATLKKFKIPHEGLTKKEAYEILKEKLS